MSRETTTIEPSETISIEISRTALARALKTGQLTACDIRGLDINAKQSLWRLCLEACRVDCLF